MDKDRIEGAAKQIKGTIKEAIGKVTGDTKIEAEGVAERAAGKVQERRRPRQRRRAGCVSEVRPGGFAPWDPPAKARLCCSGVANNLIFVANNLKNGKNTRSC